MDANCAAWGKTGSDWVKKDLQSMMGTKYVGFFITSDGLSVLLENPFALSGFPESDGLVGRSRDHDAGLGQNNSGPDTETVAVELHHLTLVQPNLRTET